MATCRFHACVYRRRSFYGIFNALFRPSLTTSNHVIFGLLLQIFDIPQFSLPIHHPLFFTDASTNSQTFLVSGSDRQTDRLGFSIPLDTLSVISEMIFLTNHLTGTSKQIKQQPNYNTNNRNDIHITTKSLKQN